MMANRWAVPAITLLAAALRLTGLNAQSLWLDEAFSVWVASAPLPVAWAAAVQDAVHPPLYYALLRGVLILGSSEALVRLPSALLGAVSVPLFYALLVRLTGRQTTARLGCLLLALSSLHLHYSQEARMYALMICLSLAVMLAFVAFLETRRPLAWVALCLLSTLAYLSHYFTLFLPLVQFLFLCAGLRQRHRALVPWALAQAVAFIPLGLWLSVVYSRPVMSFGVSWISTPRPIDLLLTLWNFTVAYSGTMAAWLPFGLALTFAAALFGAATRSAAWNPGWRWLTILWLCAPPLVTAALSTVVPLYVDRFLMVSLPAYLALIAVGLTALRPRALAAGAAALVLLLFVAAGLDVRTSPAYARGDWRGLAAYLNGFAGPNDVIALRTFQDSWPFDYYYHGTAAEEILSVNAETQSLDGIAAGRDRLWLVYRCRPESVHHLTAAAPFDLDRDEGDPSVRDWVRSHGGRVFEDSGRFVGLHLYGFDGGGEPGS